MQWLKGKDRHVFAAGLTKRARDLDYDRVCGLWEAVTDQRLVEIRSGVPGEWHEARPTVDAALALVRACRDNFSGVIEETRRVLS